MEQFRNLTNNIFFKIFLSFVGLSFITFGISDLVFESNKSWVAKIDGKKISQIDFSRRLEQQKSNIYSRNPKPEILEYINSDDFHNSFLRRVTSEEILKKLVSDMDLNLNSDLAINHIVQDKQFHDINGNFDKLKFQSFLTTNNINSDKYIDEINFNMASDMIFSSLDADSVRTNPDLLIANYQFQNQKRNISLLKISKANIKTLPKIKLEDLEKFYEYNKNKYKIDELRKIAVISIDIKDLTSDLKISEDEILSSYQKDEDQYIVPEKRNLYNMFFADLDQAQKFLNQIDKNRNLKSQFQKIAKNSFDKKESEILLDITKDQLPKKISNIVFQLPKNNISDILESDYGYHIIYVNSITQSSKKPLKLVKKDIKNKLFKIKSDQIVKEKISHLEDEIMIIESLSDFTKKFPFAKIAKLPLMNIKMISDQDIKVQNDYIQNFIEDIFLLDENQFSDIFPSEDETKYHLAFISKIIESRQQSFSESKDQIEKELTKIKTQKSLTDLVNKIDKELSGGILKIDKIVKKYQLDFDKNISLKKSHKTYPDNFMKEIFSLKKGQVSKATKINDNEYYIAILNDIKLPKKTMITKEQLDKLQSEYHRDISSDIWLKLENYLQKKYQVQIQNISSD